MCQKKLPVYYYTNLLQVSVKLVVYWNLKQYTIQLQPFPAFQNAISNPVITVSHLLPLYHGLYINHRSSLSPLPNENLCDNSVNV